MSIRKMLAAAFAAYGLTICAAKADNSPLDTARPSIVTEPLKLSNIRTSVNGRSLVTASPSLLPECGVARIDICDRDLLHAKAGQKDALLMLRYEFLLANGDLAGATADLDARINLGMVRGNKLAVLYDRRANLYLRLKDIPKALADVKQSVRLAPSLPTDYLTPYLYYTRAQAFEYSGPQYRKDAIAYYGKTIGLYDFNSSDSPELVLKALYARGKLYGAIGKKKEAADDIAMRGALHLQIGDFETAINESGEALDMFERVNSSAPFPGYNETISRVRWNRTEGALHLGGMIINAAWRGSANPAKAYDRARSYLANALSDLNGIVRTDGKRYYDGDIRNLYGQLHYLTALTYEKGSPKYNEQMDLCIQDFRYVVSHAQPDTDWFQQAQGILVEIAPTPTQPVSPSPIAAHAGMAPAVR